MSDTRTPAQIEADIISRRAQLAVVLDEIGVRMHPKTMIGDAKAKVASTVDRTAGRAYVAVNRSVSDVKAQFVAEDGSPRLERVIPAAVVVVAAVALLTVSSSRSSRPSRSVRLKRR
ncbi:DUF3618 domain-containing protein [[Kitasatospora] papulosa]|uniref:DUF3618 domain-containing protein n=1 Tax=Streptomyces TaxID=1883 RepID=UPI0004C7E2DA|nr:MULTISPECIES: DUF3618 domain-containing protein [Streptomyces]MYT59779.1 DUF3618 domain-containing protein [Streptomyces sp. SID7834]MCX4415854.1 DUF3618 domain-containing protein [[Kitasatospora] papulosa]MDX3182475.1 DUF3618 domain-containing protein [Streptomyces sp. ME02-7008A-1]MDX3302928.1 DUF3618 domain-containing protein [Streptomyces sp. ME02-7008A]QBR06662.1 DUF3618 domain-containing protein [Streptomyces sp. S501]